VITNDVSDYIDLLVRIAHIICNHPTSQTRISQAGLQSLKVGYNLTVFRLPWNITFKC